MVKGGGGGRDHPLAFLFHAAASVLYVPHPKTLNHEIRDPYHIYIYIYIYMYVCMYVCMYVFIYLFMYVDLKPDKPRNIAE